MKYILETNRLILRKLDINDIQDLKKILQDEETMYAYEHAFDNDEVQKWYERQIIRYANDGFGLWAVVLKSNQQMIGQCGLTKQDYNGQDVIEIGYLFNKDFWHQGYAIEAAKACKEYAFNNLNVDEVYSIIRDNNISSINVAKRNGMIKKDVLIKHYYGMNMPHDVYSIKNPSLKKTI